MANNNEANYPVTTHNIDGIVITAQQVGYADIRLNFQRNGIEYTALILEEEGRASTGMNNEYDRRLRIDDPVAFIQNCLTSEEYHSSEDYSCDLSLDESSNEFEIEFKFENDYFIFRYVARFNHS